MKQNILIVTILILTGLIIYCLQPETKTVAIIPIEQSENKPIEQIEQPEEIKPKFILTYSCPKERSVRFNEKNNADNLKESLNELGFETRYYRWQLLDSPIDNGPFNNPFNRNGPPVYHLIYYKTDSEVTKTFDSLDSARLWEFKLRDLGCITNIQEENSDDSSK